MGFQPAEYAIVALVAGRPRYMKSKLLVIVTTLFAGFSSAAEYHRLTQVAESMSPTIPQNTMVLVDSSSFLKQGLSRWDIVVFRSPISFGEEPWMFRIAGLPGEKLSIERNRIHIDGVLLKLPSGLAGVDYSKSDSGKDFAGFQISIPSGHFFLLGDNPKKANDSRFIGPVPRKSILGRVVIK